MKSVFLIFIVFNHFSWNRLFSQDHSNSYLFVEPLASSSNLFRLAPVVNLGCRIRYVEIAGGLFIDLEPYAWRLPHPVNISHLRRWGYNLRLASPQKWFSPKFCLSGILKVQWLTRRFLEGWGNNWVVTGREWLIQPTIGWLGDLSLGKNLSLIFENGVGLQISKVKLNNGGRYLGGIDYFETVSISLGIRFSFFNRVLNKSKP